MKSLNGVVRQDCGMNRKFVMEPKIKIAKKNFQRQTTGAQLFNLPEAKIPSSDWGKKFHNIKFNSTSSCCFPSSIADEGNQYKTRKLHKKNFSPNIIRITQKHNIYNVNVKTTFRLLENLSEAGMCLECFGQ